jgi:stringent starvation protein B
MSEPTSQKPYLLRALYEWCVDNGFTPYLAVRVDAATRVPMEFVRKGEIVLNIGPLASNGLRIGNEMIEFAARFGGVSRDIFVPVTAVQAIYARENGQGMTFDPEPPTVSDLAKAGPLLAPVDASASVLHAVPVATTRADDPQGDPPRPPGGPRPALRRIK